MKHSSRPSGTIISTRWRPYNDPGTFTALIGYEWTSTEKGNSLHRNVIYRDGQVRAQQMVPYTTAESFNPEDLWTWMETYQKETGGRVLALAHNGNLSNGIIFPVETNPATGKPLGGDYAKRRAQWAAIPNAGFHRFLLKGAKDWFARHPFSPPPFMQW